MALFAVLRTAALFKSRAETKKNQYTNVLAACTLLDIPSRWNPRAKQSHTMALFAVLRTAALFKSRTETKKNQYTNVYWFFLVRVVIQNFLKKPVISTVFKADE